MTLMIASATCSVLLAMAPSVAGEGFEKDVIPTSAGDLEITCLGHGTLMMKFAGRTIHVDPYSRVADYEKLPKADIVFITHHHGDHFDRAALDLVRAEKTKIYLTEACAKDFRNGIVMKNGEKDTVFGIKVEAVPAYNLVHKRSDGNVYHPRGEGNGYVVTFGKTRVYIAGDTENTPEMKALKDVDVAFLPMNLPYTMTPAMVADAVNAFRPKVLYPYHTGDTDIGILVGLLKDFKEIDIRIRKMN